MERSLLVHLFKVEAVMWHILIHCISCLTCTFASCQRLVHTNPGLIELERKHKAFDGIAASIPLIELKSAEIQSVIGRH